MGLHIVANRILLTQRRKAARRPQSRAGIPCGFCAPLRLCVLAFVAAIASVAAAEEPAWEFSPYRVHLTVNIAKETGLPAAVEQNFAADVTARLKAAVGGTWEITVEPASEKQAASEGSSSRGGDKRIELRVARVAEGYQVFAQEFDQQVQLGNAPVTRNCHAASALAREAATAVLAAFAPLAVIEIVQGDTVRLRLKAAALMRRDSPLVGPGTVFRPVLVKSDSRGNLAAGSAEIVPWTYLVPTGTAGPTANQRVTCRLVTGLEGAAIPDYHPHRQRLALGVSHSSSFTKLKIVTDDGKNSPQEGYEVVEELASEDGQSKSLTRVGGSGADGVVVVPPGNDTVRMLLVRHGDIALARLPLVPGLAGEVTLPLPPAGQRVAIASALASLEDDLIDRLARQQVFDKQIAAATAAGDNAAADKLRGQLRGLPAADTFTARLAEQEKALSAADATAQRLLAPKIAAITKVIAQLQGS